SSDQIPGIEAVGSSSRRGAALPRSDALRLGFCVVNGIHQDRAQLLVEERRRRPYESLEDLRRRVPLTRDELRTLAEIGALNALAGHRRDALWRIEQRLEEDLFSLHRAVSSSPPEASANLE